MRITHNRAKNGTEIRFDAKPPAAMIKLMKAEGFKWSRRNLVWYAPYDRVRHAWALREAEEWRDNYHPVLWVD